MYLLYIATQSPCKNGAEVVLTIKNATTYITSPNFPDEYDKDLNCAWRIVATNDTQVELSVEGYEIERQV